MIEIHTWYNSFRVNFNHIAIELQIMFIFTIRESIENIENINSYMNQVKKLFQNKLIR